MQHTYFPVQLDELRADIKFEEVAEERFRVGPFRVTSQLINHTTATVGYRLDGGDVSIAYVTDHEPFWWERTGARRTHRFIHPGEERHVAFVGGVDVLIHDAQYADSEYPAKRGWGHSTVEYSVDLAVRESVANAVKHGNKFDETKNVEVTFSDSASGLEIIVRDFGPGFALEEIPDPTNPENLLKANGRGILFMRTFMDEVEWSNAATGGLVVKMSKKG